MWTGACIVSKCNKQLKFNHSDVTISSPLFIIWLVVICYYLGWGSNCKLHQRENEERSEKGEIKKKMKKEEWKKNERKERERVRERQRHKETDSHEMIKKDKKEEKQRER